MDPTVTLTGPQIASIRHQLGLSQAKLAEKIGTSQPAVHRREANPAPQSGPEIILVVYLAEQSGIEIPSPEQVA